jgi:hypothetical protein
VTIATSLRSAKLSTSARRLETNLELAPGASAEERRGGDECASRLRFFGEDQGPDAQVERLVERVGEAGE